jgi:alcohol dehydrogenase, propanol-preferring
MRAMVLHHPGPIDGAPLRSEAVADPVPGPHEVLVEVEACAVCRTDLQLAEGDINLVRAPVVPGHQVVGVVERTGDAVSAVRPGDRVGVTWLAGTCGACRFCTSGRENLCEQARFTGWHRDGGFAERMTAHELAVTRLPPALAPVDAAPLLCGGVIGYRALRVAGVEPGERLGLYGFGASASLAIQVAVHWGCEVAVVTRSAEEQERARALGAVWAGSYAEHPPFPLARAITFAPVGSVVIAALRALDRGGVVAINAIHLDGIPAFPYDDLWWERSIRSVANVTRADIHELLALAAEIPVRTAAIIYPLAEANRALLDIRAGAVGGTPVLIPR